VCTVAVYKYISTHIACGYSAIWVSTQLHRLAANCCHAGLLLTVSQWAGGAWA
jgi:hypothetical protein